MMMMTSKITRERKREMIATDWAAGAGDTWAISGATRSIRRDTCLERYVGESSTHAGKWLCGNECRV